MTVTQKEIIQLQNNELNNLKHTPKKSAKLSNEYNVFQNAYISVLFESKDAEPKNSIT